MFQWRPPGRTPVSNRWSSSVLLSYISDCALLFHPNVSPVLPRRLYRRPQSERYFRMPGVSTGWKLTLMLNGFAWSMTQKTSSDVMPGVPLALYGVTLSVWKPIDGVHAFGSPFD